MKPAPVREGRLLADLHCHPGNFYAREEILKILCSPGIVGLTFYNGSRTKLLYEQAVGLPGVCEIDKKFLARIDSPFGTGYFIRTQEVAVGKDNLFHILAVGFTGEYLPFTPNSYPDPRRAVEEIHRRKGIAILNHPYVVPDREARIIKYRLTNAEEERTIEDLCTMVDEIEVFNAQCINPTFGVIVPNMNQANARVGFLQRKYNFRGTVSSDAHNRLEQVKVCGIYVDEKDLSVERLKEDLRQGNFQNDYHCYVSRYSFVRGMFWP